MVHPEHIALLPWAQMRASLHSQAKSLQENLDDGYGASSEVRVLARSSKQRFLVLCNERSVKNTFLELIDGKGASKELNICGQADHMIVLKSHI